MTSFSHKQPLQILSTMSGKAAWLPVTQKGHHLTHQHLPAPDPEFQDCGLLPGGSKATPWKWKISLSVLG